MPTRRQLILASAATAMTGALLAPPAAAASWEYSGWRFDTSGAKGALSPELIQSFQRQIDMVEGLKIKPEIKRFWRGLTAYVEPTTRGGPGAYSDIRRRMELSMTPQPKDNPVLLHELIHAWHDQQLSGGFRNPMVRKLFTDAEKSRQFPPQSYMMENPVEFIAMCASVVLWGKAARPPFERANVKAKLPQAYAFIVEEFGFKES